MTQDKSTSLQETPKKARILIVDDSKLVRLTVSKILEPQFDLVLAENGEEAWQKICDDNSIQVVFTDLGMPKLDGYGLIQRIRQSENEGIRNQPVIVITGAAEEEDVRKRVFELGATDFITKPFNSTEVLARAEAHASYRRDKENLQKNVDIDILTGTLNLAGLHKQLKKDVSFVNRHSENMALIIFELDGYKAIYQRLGEQASNRVIQQVATTLLSAVRKEDSVAREGLDKFVAVLPMAKTEGVVILAKRLCERIKSFKISVGGQVIPMTMSAGISIVRKGSATTAKELLETAAQALANAKALGAGEVQLLRLETTTDEKTTDEKPKVATTGVSAKHENELSLSTSIDGLLEAMVNGNLEISDGQLSALVKKLKPIVALMNEKQRAELIAMPPV